ncbi:MAG: hypothetical protein ACR2MB_15780, partial [Acidimicrobiales bacterium]
MDTRRSAGAGAGAAGRRGGSGAGVVVGCRGGVVGVVAVAAVGAAHLGDGHTFADVGGVGFEGRRYV